MEQGAALKQGTICAGPTPASTTSFQTAAPRLEIARASVQETAAPKAHADSASLVRMAHARRPMRAPARTGAQPPGPATSQQDAKAVASITPDVKAAAPAMAAGRGSRPWLRAHRRKATRTGRFLMKAELMKDARMRGDLSPRTGLTRRIGLILKDVPTAAPNSAVPMVRHGLPALTAALMVEAEVVLNSTCGSRS
jgi:hypothetical protein